MINSNNPQDNQTVASATELDESELDSVEGGAGKVLNAKAGTQEKVSSRRLQAFDGKGNDLGRSFDGKGNDLVTETIKKG